MLTTDRLTLRPFRPDDRDAFRALAGHWEVARMTSDIPHPLTDEDARQWLAPAADEARFALIEDDVLIGGAGYFMRTARAAEVGFWLGRAYWGRGLATEAVRAVLAYGLSTGNAAAFTSSHFTDNPASGRVLAKLGFEPAGTCRIMSIARASEVAAIYYVLPREQAAQRLCLTMPPPRLSRIGAILGRFTGSA